MNHLNKVKAVPILLSKELLINIAKNGLKSNLYYKNSTIEELYRSLLMLSPNKIAFVTCNGSRITPFNIITILDDGMTIYSVDREAISTTTDPISHSGIVPINATSIEKYIKYIQAKYDENYEGIRRFLKSNPALYSDSDIRSLNFHMSNAKQY